jgi:16S rRNA (guanine527-N7)-methyltransferase
VTDPLAGLEVITRSQLSSYFTQLLQANQSFNLTAIRDPDEAWQRHIVESASLLPLLGGAKSLIDVGTGGGLPGMVLGICRPDISVTLLEATDKKTRFLSETVQSLELSNVTVQRGRAEDAAALGSALREAFDLVTARAVAPLRTLLELTIPFAKVGGTLMAIKGSKSDEEITDAQRALTLLHATVSQKVVNASGTVLLIKKTACTSAKYPRRNGDPKHHPL